MLGRGWTGPFDEWGTLPGELDRKLPCDRHLADPDQRLVRAVDVAAPAPTTFRSLCQLRDAPYSYDWIDNRGRRSPQTLTAGLEHLETGQRMMSIFRLAEFDPGRSITAVHDGSMFGRVAITYEVTATGGRSSRLFARALVRYPPGVRGGALSLILPPGDLVMMRRQLLNLRDLAQA